MNAIPTHYNGINFRSRLEAKWARFFDLLGWPYEYEPIDLSGYIPDFVLKFDTPIAVEIKPAFTRSELKESASKAHAACEAAKMPLLCLGAALLEDATCMTVGLGLIDTFDRSDDFMGYGIEDVEFSWCTHYKSYALYTPIGEWRCLRCGGKCQEIINKPYWHWNSREDNQYADTGTINRFWSEATNTTQYKRIFQAGKG
jgi:hypothetical protein